MNELVNLEKIAAETKDKLEAVKAKNATILKEQYELSKAYDAAQLALYNERDRIAKARRVSTKAADWPHMVFYWRHGLVVDTRKPKSCTKLVNAIQSFGLPERFENRA